MFTTAAARRIPVFYSGPGYDDPVVIELGVSETPLLLYADPLVATFTFKGFARGFGTLLLDGVELTVGQVITGGQFETLDFGPALVKGLANIEFEISDGVTTETHRQWIEVSPALDATYNGSGGDDFLDGGAGNDKIVGFAGDDVMLGGTGNDQVNGGGGDDRVQGGSGVDRMHGSAGADVLRGGGNADYLIGGAGIDVLFGEAGNDYFVFSAPVSNANRDVIADFSNTGGQNDTFFLENAFMAALGPGQRMLNPAFFWEGRAAHDADDHIIYNQANGALYFDSNGNQAGGAALLAVLTNKPDIAALDFVVI
jgi:Ca2+-binding RTX toxin-like protein